MTASRRRWGTTSPRSSSRLLATSVDWSESPVTLPPGRARLTTKPPRTGSVANAKTMGIIAVADFTVGTEGPSVTMRSTWRWTNSAAISASRSGRAFYQRYSISTVRPSIQPSARSRSTKASTQERKAEASANRSPMVRSLPSCCALVASGHAAAPPSAMINFRRRIVAVMYPLARRFPKTTIPRSKRAVLTSGGGVRALLAIYGDPAFSPRACRRH